MTELKTKASQSKVKKSVDGLWVNKQLSPLPANSVLNYETIKQKRVVFLSWMCERERRCNRWQFDTSTFRGSSVKLNSLRSAKNIELDLQTSASAPV